MKKILGSVVAGSMVLLAGIENASATLAADAQTAITAAQTDATTVGGYVVAAVAVVAGVGIVLGLIRKA
ncbi:major capsid protein [Methylobacter sp. sgz302048]|uniref:major capsid protein n=1 Tax=Methylobacter sp. sgz302048 TaxID=3455945 RepID=UPI003F9F81EE